MPMQLDPDTDLDGPPPADLSYAGAVIDKAIEYMVSQNIGSLAIASALLGGSLGLLARTMPDGAILRILENAMESVQAGELRRIADPPPATAHPSALKRA